jgi:hypothetical protein
LLLEAPSPAAKYSVGKVRAGWVESKELVEGDLEVVFSENGLHKFDCVDVWHDGFVTVVSAMTLQENYAACVSCLCLIERVFVSTLVK